MFLLASGWQFGQGDWGWGLVWLLVHFFLSNLDRRVSR